MAASTSSIQQPWHLRSSLDKVDAKLNQLRIDHYDAYIESYISQSNLHDNNNIYSILTTTPTTTDIDVVLDSVDRAITSCNTVMNVDCYQSSITNDWLNAPTLLSRCFQQQAYEEALQILSQATLYFSTINGTTTSCTLSTLYNTLINTTAQKGRRQILLSLKGPPISPMRSNIRIISTLRQLNKYTKDDNDDNDTLLKLEYLNCREVYLKSCLKVLFNSSINPNDNDFVLQRLLSLVDTHRRIWTEIISTYETLFPTNDHNNAAVDYILASWASTHVAKFHSMLKTQ